MTLWKQEGTAGTYRIDDRWGAKRQLQIGMSGRDGDIVRVELAGLDDECDPVVGVPVLDLLAALQGAGVTIEQIAGVWGIETRPTTFDPPRAVRDEVRDD